MKSSSTSSILPSFSHLYIETEVLEDPLVARLRRRFEGSRVVTIESYQEVFNRAYQSWRMQKQSPKLILAKKRDGLIYPCSHIAPSFGHQHFYYNTLMMNCVYDCDYCYLQGMYPSANLVVFVNQQDYFRAVDELLARHPVYLCISYDTDLLALESLLGLAAPWIEFARQRPELLIEIRTKSANYKFLSELEPCENVILAWTLSPQPVCQRHEPKTPPLASRLKALLRAAEDGWPVRLCLDPLLRVENWRDVYDEFLRQLDRQIPWSRVRDASVGVFRMNRDYLKRIQKQRFDSTVIHYPYQVDHEKVASYGVDERTEMVERVAGHLRRHLPEERVVVV